MGAGFDIEKGVNIGGSSMRASTLASPSANPKGRPDMSPEAIMLSNLSPLAA